MQAHIEDACCCMHDCNALVCIPALSNRNPIPWMMRKRCIFAALILGSVNWHHGCSCLKRDKVLVTGNVRLIQERLYDMKFLFGGHLVWEWRHRRVLISRDRTTELLGGRVLVATDMSRVARKIWRTLLRVMQRLFVITLATHTLAGYTAPVCDHVSDAHSCGLYSACLWSRQRRTLLRVIQRLFVLTSALE